MSSDRPSPHHVHHPTRTAPTPALDGARPFALVLAGGGARGLAHAGVLIGLARLGLHPSALVGVSMGAIVATTYALDPHWLADLRGIDARSLPRPTLASAGDGADPIRAVIDLQRLLGPLLLGQGVGARSRERVMDVLERLTRGQDLEACSPRVTVVATDLRSGERVALRHGPAARAAYASAALAGVFPPLEHDGYLLADGGYADLAPIDLARDDEGTAVIAVDPYQDATTRDPRSGLEVMLRAMEICHHQHTTLRLASADLVLRPTFPMPIGTLDFRQADTAVTAGMRIVEDSRAALHDLLVPAASDPSEPSLPPA